MKKLIILSLSIILFLGTSFSTKETKVTIHQEQSAYLKSQDYKNMQKLLNTNSIIGKISTMSAVKTCFWRYRCPSGFEWYSTTHYTICPFCGNRVSGYYWCSGDPII